MWLCCKTLFCLLFLQNMKVASNILKLMFGWKMLGWYERVCWVYSREPFPSKSTVWFGKYLLPWYVKIFHFCRFKIFSSYPYFRQNSWWFLWLLFTDKGKESNNELIIQSSITTLCLFIREQATLNGLIFLISRSRIGLFRLCA